MNPSRLQDIHTPTPLSVDDCVVVFHHGEVGREAEAEEVLTIDGQRYKLIVNELELLGPTEERAEGALKRELFQDGCELTTIRWDLFSRKVRHGYRERVWTNRESHHCRAQGTKSLQ